MSVVKYGDEPRPVKCFEVTYSQAFLQQLNHLFNQNHTCTSSDCSLINHNSNVDYPASFNVSADLDNHERGVCVGELLDALPHFCDGEKAFVRVAY